MDLLSKLNEMTPSDAAGLGSHTWRGDDNVAVDAFSAKGEKYVAEFVKYACGGLRMQLTGNESVVIKLVDKFNLDIPQNINYTEAWSLYAANVLGVNPWGDYFKPDSYDMPMIERRFAEHIRIAIEVKTTTANHFDKIIKMSGMR